jgi:hypothetical protein
MAGFNIQAALDQLYKPNLSIAQAPQFINSFDFMDKPKELSLDDAIKQAQSIEAGKILMERTRREEEQALRQEEARQRAIQRAEKEFAGPGGPTLDDQLALNRDEQAKVGNVLEAQKFQDVIDRGLQDFQKRVELTSKLPPQMGAEILNSDPWARKMGFNFDESMLRKKPEVKGSPRSGFWHLEDGQIVIDRAPENTGGDATPKVEIQTFKDKESGELVQFDMKDAEDVKLYKQNKDRFLKVNNPRSDDDWLNTPKPGAQKETPKVSGTNMMNSIREGFRGNPVKKDPILKPGDRVAPRRRANGQPPRG